MSKKKKPKEKAKATDISPQLLEKNIQKLLSDNPTKAFNFKEMSAQLNLLDKPSKRLLTEVLLDMETGERIFKVGRNSYKTSLEQVYITGNVDHVNPRTAFIVSAETETDVMVKAENLNGALDGDTVKVLVYHQLKQKRAEGEVAEIIKRGRSSFVGKLELSPRYAFVVADNRKMHQDIFIKLGDLNGAKHNDKVIVEITEWSEKAKNPTGKVTDILGKAGDNEAEIHSIMAEFGLPFKFPENLEKAAEKISDTISEEEIKNRRDMRDIITLTIDPEDAKDFDDAISFRKLEKGFYEIGVHIADVTHYVKEGSILDQEAFDRATSVYLVDRTVPMLPERLSNNLCSLRPEEDKLTFSAVFEMDTDGQVHKQWFGRTIIHSNRRFTYEEAQERIESLEGDFAKELTLLNELALKLRVERFRHGAINFETTEVKFKLDENGKPLGIIPKVRKDAHKLVEDFMLLANKKVAEHISTLEKKRKVKNLTFVYRTHDHPDPEKLSDFALFARKFGHNLNTEQDGISRSLNTLIDNIEGKPEGNILQSLAIRTMAKAKYTTESKGHFGLAFSHYTHFTSPIRRYPDMMVHRLLQQYLDGGKNAEQEDYEKQCMHASEREKRAADAERASIKYKQVEFMQLVEDKDFEGIVSGVTEWGIFVEIIQTKCEGMVRMADMNDDYYEFDEKNYRVIGKRNKKMIALGDKVNVRVVNTDIDRRTIDLEFIK